MKRLMKVSYNFTTRWENAETISKEDALAICNIRYAMRLTTYAKYKSTTICSDISPELQAAILENQQQLLGVEVEQSERRVYPDGVYFQIFLVIQESRVHRSLRHFRRAIPPMRQRIWSERMDSSSITSELAGTRATILYI